MRRIRALVAIPTLAVVLALAGCGDDDDGDAGATGDIQAEATEFAFDPDEWTVTAGEEFTIGFDNVGEIEHEWAVLTEEIESEADFEEGLVLLEVEAIPAGASTTEAFTIDDAGTYQVVCALEGHLDAGMEGTLTVE